jgi:hypothetical protein
MTRVITGQLDAVIEPSTLLYQELPALRAEFERVGAGSLLTNPPYDIAAAWRLLKDVGAVVTDARGNELDDLPLLGSGPEHQTSFVASANPALHAEVLAAVAAGIERVALRR